MTFKYYWDLDLFEALLRYRMRPYLNAILKAGTPMASTADLAKLIANMERAKSLVTTAANDVEAGSAIMDRFEARLNANRDHMAKIAEYEKQLAAMDSTGDNGGPALEATFSPAPASPSESSPARVSIASSSFDHATGDPIR